MVKNLVIVGSGPAAWTAAIYASRGGLAPLLFSGIPEKAMLPGGQLMLTSTVENYPGFSEGIKGPDLMEQMQLQAQNFGTEVCEESIVEVDFKSYPFSLKSSSGEVQKSLSVIIATGAQARHLGLDNEIRLMQGGGVSTCAICDGALPIFRDQEVAVVGGGDTALEEALYLSKFAKKVFIIHRRNEFRASLIMQTRVAKRANISILWNKVIKEIKGDQNIEKVVIEDVISSKREDLNLKGLFIAIGYIPNTGFLKGQVDLDENGYITIKDNFSTQSSVKGVFACGDVMDPTYKQAVVSAGFGAMAGIDAMNWVSKRIDLEQKA